MYWRQRWYMCNRHMSFQNNYDKLALLAAFDFFDFAYTKRCFYAALSNIMSHARSIEQVIKLSLVESYRLTVLTYAVGSLSLTQRQLHDLNVCWNTAYRLLLGFNRWESVKSFIHGFGR
jgi:hypothetical protein